MYSFQIVHTAGLKEILKLLKKSLYQKDSILNNKKLNQKRITGTIKALTDFAKENEIIFPTANITKITTPKKQIQTKDIQDKDTFIALLKSVLKKLEEEINLLEKEEDKRGPAHARRQACKQARREASNTTHRHASTQARMQAARHAGRQASKQAHRHAPKLHDSKQARKQADKGDPRLRGR